MGKVVEKKDWYRAGFNDGSNGSEKWLPEDRDSKKAYLTGFYDGHAKRQANAR